MAELYRDQAVVAAEAPPFAVPALTDGTGHYSTAQPRGGMGELFGEQQADRFAEEAARIGALGGWDTPYRASPVSTCATGDDGRAC